MGRPKKVTNALRAVVPILIGLLIQKFLLVEHVVNNGTKKIGPHK